MQLRQGTIRLFRFLDIEVFLHWWWFLVAAYEINARAGSYSSFTWNVLEYLGLFLIVLTHEYGHALACRSVGGTANRIVLWPLGGVAFVDPPPRAGATLWSIAAGPLVNVALVPVFLAVGTAARSAGWNAAMPNAYGLLRALSFINIGLLFFNLLPIYPLDGGQILRSLLWFVLGRARSLMVTTVFGFIGVAGLFALAVYGQSIWMGLIAAFALMNCWNGLKQGRLLLRIAKLPRRHEFACPFCHAAPPIGEFWQCNKCMNAFDTFVTEAKCPICSAAFPETTCLDCHRRSPVADWAPTAVQSIHA
jgi:Zn-dependent protease